MVVRRLLVDPPRHTAVQAVRFLVVGLAAFAVDFAVMVLCTEWLGMKYLLSVAIGYAVGLTINYGLTVSWVFDQRRYASSRVEFMLFAGTGFAGLALTELVCWTGTDLLGADYRLSKLAALFIVAAFNFAVRKTFLFTARQPAESAVTTPKLVHSPAR